MFVSVGTSTEFSSWFDSSDSVRGALRNAQKKVLLVSEDSATDLRKAILDSGKKLLSQRDLDLLAAFVVNSPTAQTRAKAALDFELSGRQPGNMTLSRLDRENLIDPIIEERSDEIHLGETLDSVFGRKIDPFLPFCRSVTLVDPYAGKSIFDKGNKIKFLEKLAINQTFDFEIHTTVPPNWAPNEEQAAKLSMAISNFFFHIQGYSGLVTTHVYASDTRKFHNRRLGLNFLGGGIYLVLENSVSTLSNGVFSEIQNFGHLSREAFQGHLMGVQQGLRKLHTAQLRI